MKKKPEPVFPDRKLVEIPNQIVREQLHAVLNPELRRIYNVTHTVDTHKETTILILEKIPGP